MSANPSVGRLIFHTNLRLQGGEVRSKWPKEKDGNEVRNAEVGALAKQVLI